MNGYRETYAMARKIIKAYPRSDGARMLSEMLELGGGPEVTRKDSLTKLKRRRAALRRKYGETRS